MKMKKSAVKILTVVFCLVAMWVVFTLSASAASWTDYVEIPGVTIEDPWDYPLWQLEIRNDTYSNITLNVGTVLTGDNFRIAFDYVEDSFEACPCGSCCTDGMWPFDDSGETYQKTFVHDSGNNIPFVWETSGNTGYMITFGKFYVNGKSVVGYEGGDCAAVLAEVRSAANEEDFYNSYDYEEWELFFPKGEGAVPTFKRYSLYWCGDCGYASRVVTTGVLCSVENVRATIQHIGGGESFFHDQYFQFFGGAGVFKITSPLMEHLMNVGGTGSGDTDGSYQEGYDQGYQEGQASRDEDVENARSEGYNNGYQEGLEDANEEAGNAYDTGYQAGWDDRQADVNDAYDTGYSDGQTDGYQEGYSQGKEDAREEVDVNDYNEGYSVGYQEGKTKFYINFRSYFVTEYGNDYVNQFLPSIEYKELMIKSDTDFRLVMTNAFDNFGALKDEEGFQRGVTAGYEGAIADGVVSTTEATDASSFRSMVFALFDAPSRLIGSMLDFDFMDVNIFSLVKVLLTACMFGVVLMIFLKIFMKS